MSLILDALNRAERERKKSHAVPDLQTLHDPVPAMPRNKKLGWYLLLALVVTAVAIYLLNRSAEPEYSEPSPPTPARVQESAVDSQQTPRSAPEPEVPRQSVPEPISGQPQARTVQRPSARSTQQSPEAPATDAADLDALYASAREEEAATPDPVERLYTPPAVKSVPESRPQQPAAAVITDARNYQSLIDIPDIGDLPSGFRQQIPSINYSRHNYERNGSQSVIINGRSHNAGAALAEDLVLEEIYSDGIILRFKQVRFKLRALNSWINM